MKYPLFCLALVCTTLLINAQDDSLANSIKIKLPITSFIKGNVTEEVEIPVVYKTILKVNIKGEYWDTLNYNPYKSVALKFPLKITFNDSTYSSPIPFKKVITSRYGWRRGKPHKGIDIDLVTGDSVVTILEGIVRFARYSRGHGKTVVIRHYNGLETTYAHLSDIGVKANDTLAKGQYLGKGGNTGNSRGSHLHLVVSYKGVYIHPDYLFDFSEANTIRAKELWVTKKWTQPVYHNSKRLKNIDTYQTKAEALASLVKQRKVYVVRGGDTLSRISQKNNVSISAICKTNAIRKTSTLKIGQKLVLEL
ncbi:M23 family metallopeptidase [Winogradskyella sp. UBA3174]|uniref:M23 family metallopeptidase n=1 Tax=Winogradskyella sp. UBA3174 TaxID=1947785 RepID=UPI0025F37859|nr:M23 family metallopeptidase [Winogradskyella sp. UBA3174]|tara:strand:- start:14406 stop:15329 length:924 start_codon:yes stop_codon:yes gene_type:complete